MTPRTKDPNKLHPKAFVRAHQGGTYSGRHVTLPHFGCGHLITAPASIAVTRMSFAHFGHGMSSSTAFVMTSLGPLTMDGGEDINQLFLANDERMHHYQRRRTSITGLGL